MLHAPPPLGRAVRPGARAVAEAEPTGFRLRLWFDDEVGASNDAEAGRVGGRLVEILADDAEALNELGWTLLTEKPYAGRFRQLALRVADALARLETLPGGGAYYMFDTRALAKFENGLIDEAIALQERALLLGGAGDEEYEARMRRYRAAKRDR